MSGLDAGLLREVAQNCVCASLRRFSRQVTKVYDDALRPTGLRATQMTLLVALGHVDEIPVSKLGAILGMDRTTLTRNLLPLERDGLLSIGASAEDGRRKLVRMTTKGEHALERALPLWREAQTHTLAVVGTDRWEKIRKQLGALTP